MSVRVCGHLYSTGDTTYVCMVDAGELHDLHDGHALGVLNQANRYSWPNEHPRPQQGMANPRLVAIPSVLEEAQSLIYGERQGDYGPPTESFDSIARLWNAYLGTRDATYSTESLNATDVAHMMILMKISRAQTGGSYKRDNYVDIAGYAGCVERIVEGK